MRRSVFAKLDDLDPETRSAAEAAARKAGLRLEDWVSEILADRLARQSSPPPKKRPAADDFETLIGRMARSAGHSVQDDADASQSDADAVESIARWIERAEARLADLCAIRRTIKIRIPALAMSEALTALKDLLTRWSAECRRNALPLGSSFRSRKRSKPSRPLPTPWSACEPTFRNLPIAARLDLSRRNQPRPSTRLASQIADLKAALAALATRAEIDSLDGSLQGLARDL